MKMTMKQMSVEKKGGKKIETNEVKRLSISFPQPMYEKIDNLALMDGRGFGSEVIYLLKVALKELESFEQQKSLLGEALKKFR